MSAVPIEIPTSSPAEPAAGSPRVQTVGARTDGVLSRVVVRHGLRDGTPVLLNSASAFAYAPGTWQVQHLVSANPRDYDGTLVVLAALLEWLHEAGVGHLRAAFRPDNPGDAPLFLGLRHVIRDELMGFRIVDYGCVRAEAVRLAIVPSDVEVVRIRAGQAAAAIGF